MNIPSRWAFAAGALLFISFSPSYAASYNPTHVNGTVLGVRTCEDDASNAAVLVWLAPHGSGDIQVFEFDAGSSTNEIAQNRNHMYEAAVQAYEKGWEVAMDYTTVTSATICKISYTQVLRGILVGSDALE